MQRARDGFTIVELIITLVVMVILTGLSVVIIGNIQAQARDSERQQDVEAIARGLEQYYKQGNPRVPNDSSKGMGGYPGTAVIKHIQGADMCSSPDIGPMIYSGFTPVTPPNPPTCDSSNSPYTLQAFPGITEENIKGPTPDSLGLVSRYQVANKDDALNQDAYYYEAFYPSGGSCIASLKSPGSYAPACSNFTLSYKKETGSQEVVTIKSRHQQ